MSPAPNAGSAIHRTLLACAWIAGACGLGSSDRTPPLPTVTATVTRNTGNTIVHLSMSPTAAALATPDVMSSPLVLERVALPDTVRQAHIADVAALSDGRVAVLLRDLKQIVVVRSGAVERHFGRAGRGPGEFRDPIALEARSDGFAVLDSDAMQVFNDKGEPLRAVRLPWMPDWGLAYNRRPLLYHQAPFQMGPEDFSHRIGRMRGGYVVIARDRASTLVLPLDGAPQLLPLSLVAVAADGGRADSVRSVRGPLRIPSTIVIRDRSGAPMSDVVPILAEPLFEDRPLVAGSDRWFAVFDPARGRVEITFADTTQPVVVDWPVSPISVTDSMRVRFMEWFNADMTTAAADDSIASVWQRRAAKLSFEMKLRQSRSAQFAPTVASIAAMFAEQECLWLIGTDPRDFSDGTSHWGVQLDIRTLAVRGPFRLAERGMQLRDVGHGFAYSTGRTWEGEFYLERTPLPDCTRFE